LQVIVIFASLSVFALSLIYLRAIWLVASPLFQRSSHHAGSKEHAFFHTQLGHYAACLLAGNFFTSAGGVMVGNLIARGSMEGKFTTVESTSHIDDISSRINMYSER
jgi:hypothetical protein